MLGYCLGFLLCGFAIISTATAATWQVTYADWERPNSVFDKYPVELLDLALSQTGVKYNLKPSNKKLSQSQATKQLMMGGGLNVVWASTDKYRDRELLPIRIPIFKGLIGWRTFLLSADDMADIDNVTSIEGLRNYTAVQGSKWVDTKILLANGFDVKTSEQYDELFLMTKQSPKVFFPRSVVEVDIEANSTQSNGLVANKNIGIFYPLAFYFYVHKKDKLLAKVIEDGLEKAIEKGLFEQLFLRYHQTYLDEMRVSERQFLQLTNPLLPAETPLERRELWYQPISITSSEGE